MPSLHMGPSKWARSWLRIIKLLLREVKISATFLRPSVTNSCRRISNNQYKPLGHQTIKDSPKLSNYWTPTTPKTTNNILHCCQTNFKMFSKCHNTPLRRILQTTHCCTKYSRCPICWTRQELEKPKPTTTQIASKASFSRRIIGTKNLASHLTSMQMIHRY